VVASGGKEDKPEVAARVAWSGVGRRLRSETPSPAQVRAAVRSVLDDPAYRERARALQASIAQAGGLRQLTEVVDAVSEAPRVPG
jgi:UDP:flavonoid glycosyltransferase YjiC (YdhE family)